jgi:predicted ATPase
MQNVLSRRLPSVSTKRTDVPEVVSAIIAKMTQKNIDNRYNSLSGLRHDLQQIKVWVDAGDVDGLGIFEIGARDISSHFILPSAIIGRKKEQDQIQKVIERFSISNRTRVVQAGPSFDIFSLGFSSSTESKPNSGSLEEATYEVASLKGTESSGSVSEGSVYGQSNRTSFFKDAKLESKGRDASAVSSSMNANPNAYSVNSASAMLRQSGHKRKGTHSTVVIISGAPGSGKSALLQWAQTSARQHGYYAAAKFNESHKVPYEPMLRIMASLFRQIFSEADVNTPFHNHIRSYIMPVWNILHTHLGLPSWLLSQDQVTGKVSSEPNSRKQSRRESSSSLSSTASNPASEWVRGNSTKSNRFMTMFSGVLHVIASLKFVCLGLDDLQNADRDSLELLNHVSAINIPIVIVATTRDDTFLANKFTALNEGVLKISLAPFSEEETAEFVAMTMHREREYVLPLVAVIQEKTEGSPFFVREMLETCFRKEAIYFSWPNSAWEFDLDKTFTEFVSQDYGSRINNDFVTKRLQELPKIARSLLAWASLLGSTFQFSLVKTLMTRSKTESRNIPFARRADPVSGLQSALSAYILIACEDEDRFRFAHDRYLQAAQTLLHNFDQAEMHFAIAKLLVRPQREYGINSDSSSLHMKSRHITEAMKLINQRETHKRAYREILYAAAENAMESGAKSTAVLYIKTCIGLLESRPWQSGKDSSYDETLKLHVKAAECFWYGGRFSEATEMVKTVYAFATDPLDKAPCWIIESRIYAENGNSQKAHDRLRSALGSMGVDIPDATQASLDRDFKEILPYLRSLNSANSQRITQERPDLEALGIMLVEFIGSAFHCEPLLLQQAAMVMIKVHMDQGEYAQCGIGYLHLACMLAARPGMLELACQLADYARDMFDVHHDDSFTAGRGLTLHSLFFGHLQHAPSYSINQLAIAYEASLTSGDRIVSTLNTGVAATIRLWITQDISELEFSLQEAAMELTDWEVDLRGGMFVISARQFVRALQGKTNITSATGILDDDDHHAAMYEAMILERSSLPDRQLFVYWTYKFMALFSYGHIDAATELGEKAVSISAPWG